MRSTTRFAIPFPEEEDFGDGALEIETLAEAVDTLIADEAAAFEDAAAVPAVILRSTGASPAYGFGVANRLTWDVVDYGPFSATHGVLYTFVGTPIPTVTQRADSGWYRMNVFATVTPAGAVDAGTYRMIEALVTDNSTFPAGVVAFRAQDYDDGEANMSLMVEAPVYMSPNSTIVVNFWHGNTLSTLSVDAGFRLSLVRIGPTGN